MTCRNILRRNFWWAVDIIRGPEVPIMRSGRVPGTRRRGFTTKEETYTTMSIGLSVNPGEGIVGQKMPTRYVIEMFIDRIAASKTYQGENYKDTHPLAYYEQGAAKLGRMIHPDTAKQLHFLLTMLEKKGEEETFAYTVIKFFKKIKK